MNATMSDIAALLTPQQQNKLEELQKARRDEHNAKQRLREALKPSELFGFPINRRLLPAPGERQTKQQHAQPGEDPRDDEAGRRNFPAVVVFRLHLSGRTDQKKQQRSVD